MNNPEIFLQLLNDTGSSRAQATSTIFDRIKRSMGPASSRKRQPSSVPSSSGAGTVSSAYVPGMDLFEYEEIPISAIVVSAKSRVLRAMLFNGMKESDKSQAVIVRVTAEGESHLYCICFHLNCPLVKPLA